MYPFLMVGSLSVSASFLILLVFFWGGGCISFDRVVLILFLYSRSSFVYVPLICSCSADEVRDWRPSIFLGMVEARLIDLDNIRINIRICPFSSSQ